MATALEIYITPRYLKIENGINVSEIINFYSEHYNNYNFNINIIDEHNIEFLFDNFKLLINVCLYHTHVRVSYSLISNDRLIYYFRTKDYSNGSIVKSVIDIKWLCNDFNNYYNKIVTLPKVDDVLNRLQTILNDNYSSLNYNIYGNAKYKFVSNNITAIYTLWLEELSGVVSYGLPEIKTTSSKLDKLINRIDLDTAVTELSNKINKHNDEIIQQKIMDDCKLEIDKKLKNFNSISRNDKPYILWCVLSSVGTSVDNTTVQLKLSDLPMHKLDDLLAFLNS